MGTLSAKTPKPLLPVLNRPLLSWNLDHMSSAGVLDIAVNTHHLGSAFSSLPAFAARCGLRVKLVHEASLTGPFGGVLACATVGCTESDALVVFAADGLYSVDIRALVEVHRAMDAELTIGVAPTNQGWRYGVVEIEQNGLVRGMVEKSPSVGITDTASCGVYVVSAALASVMSRELRPLDWIDVVRARLGSGGRIASAPVHSWHDAGTPADLLTLNLRMLNPSNLERLARLEPTCQSINASVWRQGPLRGIRNAEIHGTSLIGSGVSLADGVRLSNSVIGPGVRIGRCASVSRSVLLPGTVIPAHATIEDTIVG